MTILSIGNIFSILEYALKLCDVVTLCVPNGNKFIVDEKNHAGNREFEIGHCEVRNDPEHTAYYEKATRFIEKLLGDHIIKTYFDTQYIWATASCELKIYYIRMNQEVMNVLGKH